MKIKSCSIIVSVLFVVLSMFGGGCGEDTSRPQIEKRMQRTEASVVALVSAADTRYEEAQAEFQSLLKYDTDNWFVQEASRTMEANLLMNRVQTLLDSAMFDRAYATIEIPIRRGRGTTKLRREAQLVSAYSEMETLIRAVSRIRNTEMAQLCLERIKQTKRENKKFSNELLALTRVCKVKYRQAKVLESSKSVLLLWLDYDIAMSHPGMYPEMLRTEIENVAPHLGLSEMYRKNDGKPLFQKSK